MAGRAIRGLGVDIVSVPRIADLLDRHADRFLRRCFRPEEIEQIERQADPAPAAAAAWAAKEACLKALGVDVSGIPYQDVEVTGLSDPDPGLRLHGRAAAVLDAGADRPRCWLSLARTRQQAVAFVLLEG